MPSEESMDLKKDVRLKAKKREIKEAQKLTESYGDFI
jgi:hypothetical protein